MNSTSNCAKQAFIYIASLAFAGCAGAGSSASGDVNCPGPVAVPTLQSPVSGSAGVSTSGFNVGIANGASTEQLRLVDTSGTALEGGMFVPGVQSPQNAGTNFFVASVPQLAASTTYTVFIDNTPVQQAGCSQSAQSFNVGSFTTR